MTRVNPFVFDSDTSVYISHQAKTKSWIRQEEKMDVNYIQVDIDSYKLGWGKFNPDNRQYLYEWQEKVQIPIDRPAEDYRRAFSIWLYPVYIDGDKNINHGVCLWRRHTSGEWRGFQDMMKKILASENDVPNSDNLLPTVKYTGFVTDKNKTGMDSVIPQFEVVKWSEKKEDFVIPEWFDESSPSDNQNNDFLPKSDGDTQTSNPVLDTLDSGDIPF